MSSVVSEGPIYISIIALEIRQQFAKPVYNVIFQTGTFKKVIPGEFPPGHNHNEVFNPPLKLFAPDQLSVSMQYRSNRIAHTLRIPMDQSKIVRQARNEGRGKESYVIFHNNIVVNVAFSRNYGGRHLQDLPSPTAGERSDVPSPDTTTESFDTASLSAYTSQGSSEGPLSPSSSDHLSPTTNEVLRICPRFRLLIIGNSGVGKSTLIRNVFGVKEVDVSAASRGRADIDREFVAPENELFVVHDSMGLEAADGNNFVKVKNFIRDRQRRKELKDRLHAVWVCIQIPYAKGRVLEAGMEEFLQKRKDIVGDIPVVVVLTKLDLLDNLLITDLRKERVQFRSMEEVQPHLRPRRSAFITEYCTKSLQRALKNDIPHLAVSTKSGYLLESTMAELVKTTISEIEWYIRADPSYTTATEKPSERNAQLYIAEMAQRASIEKKVDLTIKIGKKKYWSKFAACIGFSAGKLEDYLLVLHKDITRAWNFNDPEKALQGGSFIEALLDTSDLGVNIPATKAKSSTSFASVMPFLLNDPAAVAITFPLTGAVGLGKLFLKIHNSANAITKCFMAYIVDLINVMKILFILVPHASITLCDVARALDAYKKLPYRGDVHKELKDFNAGFAVLPKGRDVVVDTIETLVRRYDITDEEVSRLRRQVQAAPRRS